MMDKTWLNRAAALNVCYGLFIMGGEQFQGKGPEFSRRNRGLRRLGPEFVVFERKLRDMCLKSFVKQVQYIA